ncbi:hypothetical protein FACS1894202_14230 [Clostridia bacterium]|nr:hypothetical protein FACS1894202_14230 [Clostridia bacterium]
MNKKRIVALFVVCVMLSLTVVSALASEGDPVDMGSILSDSFTVMVADLLSSLGAILPIALSVFGAIFAVKIGMKVFRGTANGTSGG